jgi:hypothetical protein
MYQYVAEFVLQPSEQGHGGAAVKAHGLAPAGQRQMHDGVGVVRFTDHPAYGIPKGDGVGLAADVDAVRGDDLGALRQ